MDFAKFLVKGKLYNVILTDDFINRETGEVRPGRVILQFMVNKKGKLDFLDVTAPKQYYNKFLPKKNQVVEVPVIIKCYEGQIFFNFDEEVSNEGQS